MVLIGPRKHCVGPIIIVVVKFGLAYRRHYESIRTQVPFQCFLLYGPPNQ